MKAVQRMKRLFAGMLGLLLLLASACSPEPEGGLESQSESPSLSSGEGGEQMESQGESEHATEGSLALLSLFYQNRRYASYGMNSYVREKDVGALALGEYLGKGKPDYDAFHPNDPLEYPDFTVNEQSAPPEGMVYSIYTLPGYDPGFRLCGVLEREDTGEKEKWITLYEYLDEDALRWGGELYQDRLHLRETAVSLKPGFLSEEKEDAPLPEQWNAFLDALSRAEFQTLTWKQQRDELKGPMEMHVRTRDGLPVRLALYENGWIRYYGMEKKLLHLEGDVYNQVYEYCCKYYRS